MAIDDKQKEKLMRERLSLFKPSDLIHIAICVGSAVLCVIGIFKADSAPPIVVCSLTGLFFLAGIPLLFWIRSKGYKPDYVTKHELFVKNGKKNKHSPEVIEKWTGELIAFWTAHYDRTKIEMAFKGKLLVCLDEYKISVWGKFVHGYAGRGIAVIGWREPNGIAYAKSLFRHEMSHHILEYFTVWNETLHHKIFIEKGLEGIGKLEDSVRGK